MAFYEFAETLAYSQGVQQATDVDTIRAMIPGCVEVVKADLETDKTGIDYIATLRRGAQVTIDAKTRTPNSSRFWRNGIPDLALERWSVIPQPGMSGKAGWTLSEASPVDYILFTFHPGDCPTAYLYPFQLLRTVFIRNYDNWLIAKYKVGFQSSDGWKSECLFVPEPVVWAAMREVIQLNPQPVR